MAEPNAKRARTEEGHMDTAGPSEAAAETPAPVEISSAAAPSKAAAGPVETAACGHPPLPPWRSKVAVSHAPGLPSPFLTEHLGSRRDLKHDTKLSLSLLLRLSRAPRNSQGDCH